MRKYQELDTVYVSPSRTQSIELILSNTDLKIGFSDNCFTWCGRETRQDIQRASQNAFWKHPIHVKRCIWHLFSYVFVRYLILTLRALTFPSDHDDPQHHTKYLLISYLLFSGCQGIHGDPRNLPIPGPETVMIGEAEAKAVATGAGCFYPGEVTKRGEL